MLPPHIETFFFFFLETLKLVSRLLVVWQEIVFALIVFAHCLDSMDGK